MILIKNYRGRLSTVLGALFGRTGFDLKGFTYWNLVSFLEQPMRRHRSRSAPRKGPVRAMYHM